MILQFQQKIPTTSILIFALNDQLATSLSTQRHHPEKQHFLYPCPYIDTCFVVMERPIEK